MNDLPINTCGRLHLEPTVSAFEEGKAGPWTKDVH
jgi:hypothetical protein